VRTYHETGRLIHHHVLLGKHRGDYGAQVIARLARDTGTHERRLYECRQFYRCFPNLRLTAELGWTRGLLLTRVADAGARDALVAQALKHDWPSEEIKTRVRALNAAALTSGTEKNADADAPPAIRRLVPRRGTPGLHPVVDRGDGPVVDLGFKLYRAPGGGSKLTAGDIVRLTADGVRRVDGATRAELFTYAATVRRVVDGDTLLVALDVAPGMTLEKLLRLRGIDCPEANTAAGRAAKRFVEERISVGAAVILSTTKPDKYDRSLADVFVSRTEATGSGPNEPVDGASEVFLNHALLEHGHAIRYDGGPKDA
jgi:endonuclease YncB( thermonuclease family)